MDRARDKILDEIMSFDTSEETKKLINVIKSYSSEELYKLHKLKDEKMNKVEFFLMNCYTAKRILENIESERFASLREKLMTSQFYSLEIDYLRNMAAIANYFTDLSVDSLARKHYNMVKEAKEAAVVVKKMFNNLKLPENEEENIICNITSYTKEIMLNQKDYEKLYDEYLVSLYAASLNNNLVLYHKIFWEFLQKVNNNEIDEVFCNLDKFLEVANILLNSKIDEIVPDLMKKMLIMLKNNVEIANSLYRLIISYQMLVKTDNLFSKR